MAEYSTIEWTDHTFNPWRGCTKVSPGCKFCYAATQEKRFGIEWGTTAQRVVKSENTHDEPLAWNRKAHKAGTRHRVFCGSLCDVFEGPETMAASNWTAIEQARQHLFDLIDATPHLDWLLLTKRPENIRRFWTGGYRANVWRMTSIENQAIADVRIPALLDTNDLSPVAGLSCEPLLEAIDITPYTGIHWVITGGESGSGARVMLPDWARVLRAQSGQIGAAFFVKQLGSVWAHATGAHGKGGDWDDLPYDLRIREYPVVLSQNGTTR